MKSLYIPTTPSSIFFRLLTFNLQLCPTSVFILEFHVGVKYSGAISVRASAIATPSDNSEKIKTHCVITDNTYINTK